MNILQISSLKISETDLLLSNGVSSILDISKFGIPHPLVSIWDETQNFSDFDIIILGTHDYGITLSSDLCLKLTKFRDEGGGILFTHSCPRIWENTDDMSNHDPENQSRLNWISLCFTFGITDFNPDFKYIFFSIIHPEGDHPILTKPFIITHDLNIQETHNTGLVLSKNCQVIIPNPFDITSSSNFYLAIFEETNKGKIAYCSLGHNNFSSSIFYPPPIAECQLFLNILFWLASN